MGGVKVAGSCCLHLHWQQPLLPHAPSSSPQTLASIFSSISSRKSMSMCKSKRRGMDDYDTTLNHHAPHQTPFLGGTSSAKFSRRPSLDGFNGRSARKSKQQILRRAYSASLDNFTQDDEAHSDDEEFVRQLQESPFNLHRDDDTSTEIRKDLRNQKEAETSGGNQEAFPFFSVPNPISPSAEPPWPAIPPEPPNWLDRDEIMRVSMEMKANSVDLPVSLRIIKQRKKKKWEQGFREAGESACCSVSKAFSSMVFIVRELQSYTLQMREVLFYENVQGILGRVQGEMNASFVWLFQQIFSRTPTLMVYVMLLLANFTVYSIGGHNSLALAAVSPNPPAQAVAAIEQQGNPQRFDGSSIKSFSVGRTASVGGNGGGGGKVNPVAGAADDWGQWDGSSSHLSCTQPTVTEQGGDASATAVTEEEEVVVWNRTVEEASRILASSRDEALMDPDTLQQLVSPLTVELEPEDESIYLQTELMYHEALSQDPDNVLLLSNFAQFLYLVLHDHDRAEYYFRRAMGVKPADAEALDRYANFLWFARKDLGAAEETYLEAIAADPGNSHYAANYAHFLWNTGGEETCYPLDGSDAC